MVRMKRGVGVAMSDAVARKKRRRWSVKDFLTLAAGVLFVVLVGPPLLRQLGVWDDLRRAGAESLRAEGVTPPTTAQLMTVRNLAVAVVVLLVVVLVVRGVSQAQARRWGPVRESQMQDLRRRLGQLMPPTFDPASVKVEEWRGDIPLQVWLVAPRAVSAESAEWRLATANLFRQVMGPIQPIRWPADTVSGARRRRVSVTALSTREAADRVAAGKGSLSREEQIVAALAGLVPAPHPRVKESDSGSESIVIGYGETTRDGSPAWRDRVVKQLSSRLGGDFRATWDRQRRRVVLAPVPPLPAVIDWRKTYEGCVADLAQLPLTAVYATDESGAMVAWQPGDRTPHALFTGSPGTGKTEAMKAGLMSVLEQGALVAISDPKRVDFAEFLGRPSVICVATSVPDRVGLLVDMRAEMQRRAAAAALRKLERLHNEGVSSAEDLDQVPIILVLDELTQHTKDVQKWWGQLTKDERIDALGSSSTTCPALSYPGEIVQLARAVGIHVLVGMQRADAGNFGGDSTMMRELIEHNASMGQLKPIGSEMQWGDRRIGTDVVINGVGEGLSNGVRIRDGAVVPADRPGPGRIKAWYVAGTAEDPQWWAENVGVYNRRVERISMPSITEASRNPVAAMAALRKAAGLAAAAGSAGPVVDYSALAPTAPLGGDIPAPDGLGSVRPAPPVTPGSAERVDSAVVADDLGDGESERDETGGVWTPVPAADLAEGAVVSIGSDIVAALVVDVVGETVDEFDDSEVFRIVIEFEGEESTLDLNMEETVYVRAESVLT